MPNFSDVMALSFDVSKLNDLQIRDAFDALTIASAKEVSRTIIDTAIQGRLELQVDTTGIAADNILEKQKALLEAVVNKLPTLKQGDMPVPRGLGDLNSDAQLFPDFNTFAAKDEVCWNRGNDGV